MISKLIKQANNRIIILAGGGINISNIEELMNIGVKEFHGSLKTIQTTTMINRPSIAMGIPSIYLSIYLSL
jgi:copper homeostasis protein CutC